MKLILSKNYEVPPLNRVAYVDDQRYHLSMQEIARFVEGVVKFASSTYSKEDVIQAVLDGVELVYGEEE